MFATAIHFHLSLIFAGKELTIKVEFCKAFHSGSLLVLPTNIRLGWKSMQVANTLITYDTAIITAVKCFIVQAPDLVVSLLIQRPKDFIALIPRESVPFLHEEGQGRQGRRFDRTGRNRTVAAGKRSDVDGNGLPSMLLNFFPSPTAAGQNKLERFSVAKTFGLV